MTPARPTSRPRALETHDRLTRKLQALYNIDTAVNTRRGAEVGNTSERPTPMSSAVIDTQRGAERLLGYLEQVITHVLTGGDSVVRVSGWWGRILCPTCQQDTLLHDLGEQRVSCTNPDCDDDGQPWWDTERWLYGRITGLDPGGDESLTISERQRQTIVGLQAEIVYWRDQAADWRELYEQTITEKAG